MICKTVVLPATSASLVDVLAIDPLLRGGMNVRLQVTAGTLSYGSKAAQAMTLAAPAVTDLAIVNGVDLHLRGVATVNILVHFSDA